ncbi:MAG: hypothetical protein V1799_13690, partial [bacterium]
MEQPIRTIPARPHAQVYELALPRGSTLSIKLGGPEDSPNKLRGSSAIKTGKSAPNLRGCSPPILEPSEGHRGGLRNLRKGGKFARETISCARGDPKNKHPLLVGEGKGEVAPRGDPGKIEPSEGNSGDLRNLWKAGKFARETIANTRGDPNLLNVGHREVDVGTPWLKVTFSYGISQRKVTFFSAEPPLYLLGGSPAKITAGKSAPDHRG